MVQAQWDNMIWWVSTESLRSLGELEMTRELNIETTEASEDKPKTQEVNMKLDTLNISYEVSRVGGVDPRSEYNEWYWRIGLGVHAPFYINGSQWGSQEYMLKKVSYSCPLFAGNGQMISATIDLEFMEYQADGRFVAEMSHHVDPMPGVREYKGNERNATLSITALHQKRMRGESW